MQPNISLRYTERVAWSTILGSCPHIHPDDDYICGNHTSILDPATGDCLGILLLASDMGLHVDDLLHHLSFGLVARQVTDEEGPNWDFHE